MAIEAIPAPPIRLWVDDVRHCPAHSGGRTEWIWSLSEREAVTFLELLGQSGRLSRIVQVSLDHDLGDGGGTGYAVACWLERAAVEGRWRPREVPVLTCHSANPVGRTRIEAAFASIRRVLEASP